jgi:hypothetical protein
MGMKFEILSSDKMMMSRGYWVGIQVDSTAGHLKGGVSQGLEGSVKGY